VTAGRIGVVVVLALACGLTAVSGARLERTLSGRSAEQTLLYLPSGEHLGIVSLGHAPLVADLVSLWAIQYYSNYEREDRHRYVEHVFDRVITELDPHYVDAYWLGALILIVEVGELESGLRLLDKGIRNNPESWILPYLAAWECYHARRLPCAASYFERAAGVPGAPTVVRRMRAGVQQKMGDVAGSLRQWEAILRDPASDAASQAIARRQLRELHVARDLERLDGAIERFRTDNGRSPERLEALVAGGYIETLPRDPEGRAYVYDPREGRARAPAGRVLGGK
jgi:hypothetical protein